MFIAYWISTSLLAILLLVSAVSYVFSASAISGFNALGFPDFFRVELVILKALAAVVIIVPLVPFWLKEWAYAGTALFLITAIVAHHTHGDPIILNVINIAIMGVLIISRLSLEQL